MFAPGLSLTIVLRASLRGTSVLIAVHLQGEMGPDGAKGERGEPGMTVSAWQGGTTGLGLKTPTTITQQSEHAQLLDI